MSPPSLAKFRSYKQSADQPPPRAGPCITGKRPLLGRSRRDSQKVKTQPPVQDQAIRLGTGRQTRFFEPGKNERVDRRLHHILEPRPRNRRSRDGLECPVIMSLRCLCLNCIGDTRQEERDTQRYAMLADHNCFDCESGWDTTPILPFS